MFNWFGNRYPYSDIHSLNLDWILEKMKETTAQAMKAVADAANALAQVAEAKAAALSAQTAAQDAQTAAGQAAVNAASAAANAVQALNSAQTAQETATAANNKAQTAQETATAANNKAQTAQTAAETAQTAAETAQTTAETAQSTAETAQTNIETLNGKFPIKTADIADNAVTSFKMLDKKCAITTSGGKSTGVFPAPFTDTAATNISHITEELSPGRFGSLLLDTTGIYFQPIITFHEPPNGEHEDIQASFSPFHFDPATVGHAEYTPFIIENLTTNKVMKGYARIRNLDGSNYKFQMFFDEAPAFTAGYQFNIEILSIGGVINRNF